MCPLACVYVVFEPITSCWLKFEAAELGGGRPCIGGPAEKTGKAKFASSCCLVLASTSSRSVKVISVVLLWMFEKTCFS